MARPSETLAKHARPSHPEKASLPSSLSSQVFQLSNNEKSGRLQQGSSLPAPTILLDFLRRFGSGSRSRYVTSAIDGYRNSPVANSALRSVPEKVCRQSRKWPVSNLNNRQTKRRRAIGRATYVWPASC